MSTLVALLALPLLGALAAAALPQQAARRITCVIMAATLGAAVLLARNVLTSGVQRLAPGGWAPPVGIVLEADGLSAALVVLSALVMTGAGLSARHDLSPGSAGPRMAFGFWPLMLFLWAGLNAVFLSRDLFNLYVGIELLSLAAIGLVAISGKPPAIAAAMRYMTFALAGSLLYLAGVILVYAGHGTLDMGLLAARTPAATDTLALALMTVGLMAKTALFPFHVWLPPAHGSAPAPASAILSALVPKASFAILLRLWFDTMPDLATQGALIFIAALGTAAVAWGSLRALALDRLKLMVAYSTVAQIGYLFLVFPLAGGGDAAVPWSAGAWSGAIFLALSHGLANAAMFLAVGQWMIVTGSDRLDDLRGLAVPMPMSAFAFALAAITLIGLPPSDGFTGKYLIMTAAFASGQWVWALVMVLGGLLAAAYLYRPMAVLFARGDGREITPLPRSRQVVPLVLAGASVVLGLASDGTLDLLTVGRPPRRRRGCDDAAAACSAAHLAGALGGHLLSGPGELPAAQRAQPRRGGAQGDADRRDARRGGRGGHLSDRVRSCSRPRAAPADRRACAPVRLALGDPVAADDGLCHRLFRQQTRAIPNSSGSSASAWRQRRGLRFRGS